MDNKFKEFFDKITIKILNIQYLFNKKNILKLCKSGDYKSAEILFSKNKLILENSNYMETLTHIVKEFYINLKENCSNFDSSLFENNFPKTCFKLYNIDNDDQYQANYCIIKNKSKITSNSFKPLTHELLHMSSSKYNNNTYYVGFHYRNTNVDIGYGINEGYTEMLNNRYFPNYKFDSIYTLQVMIAKVLESILTKDKLETLYFKGDFFGLFEELKKYKSEDEVISFLNDVDNINIINKNEFIKEENNVFGKNNVISDKIVYLQNTIIRVYDFLFDCFKLKVNKIENFEEKIKMFDKKMWIDEIDFNFCSDDVDETIYTFKLLDENKYNDFFKYVYSDFIISDVDEEISKKI